MLYGDDEGQALINAVDGAYEATVTNEDRLDANEARLDDLLTEETTPVTDENGDPVLDEDGDPVTETNEVGRIVDIETEIAGLTSDDDEVMSNTAAIGALTAVDDPATEDVDETGAVTANTNDIARIDGVSIANENAIADHATKLAAKKEYIDNIGEELGFDPATGLGTGDGGNSRIDTNEAGIAVNTSAIAAETEARTMAVTALGGRIDDEATSPRWQKDTALGGRIDDEATTRMSMADTALGGRIDDRGNQPG